ncbi:MAG: hypothetical protein ACQJCO_01740 [cyanobacterium endosymbiont of Rhopalodia sterrenbergii]
MTVFSDIVCLPTEKIIEKSPSTPCLGLTFNLPSKRGSNLELLILKLIKDNLPSMFGVLGVPVITPV